MGNIFWQYAKLRSQDCRQAAVRVHLLRRSRKTSNTTKSRYPRSSIGNPRRSYENQEQKRKEGQQSSNEQSIARSPRLVCGVRRSSRRYRSACTRTHFSGLRLGTSHESGTKNKEAQYSYSLPKRPKLRSLLEKQDNKGSCAEDALAKQYLEQKSLVT